VAVSDDQTNSFPAPITPNGNSNCQMGVFGAISSASQVSPIADSEKPKPRTGPGWYLSIIMPARGASAPSAIAIGAISALTVRISRSTCDSPNGR
jgi:hypothetical protein